MPMVTPRPSYFGFFATKSVVPVSRVGMYGLASGVLVPGALLGAEPSAETLPGAGSSIGMVSSRSTASTFESAATFSTREVGTLART